MKIIAFNVTFCDLATENVFSNGILDFLWSRKYGVCKKLGLGGHCLPES